MPALPHAAIIDAAAPHDDAVAAHDGRSSPPTVGERFVLHSGLHCAHFGLSHLVGSLSLTPLPPRQRRSLGIFRSHASPGFPAAAGYSRRPDPAGPFPLSRPLPAAARAHGSLGLRA
jgi:hypothetical protein